MLFFKPILLAVGLLSLVTADPAAAAAASADEGQCAADDTACQEKAAAGSPEQQKKRKKKKKKYQRVRIIDWDMKNKNFAKTVMDGQYPVVIKKNIAEKYWPALKKWNWEYLEKNLLKDGQTQVPNVFQYDRVGEADVVMRNLDDERKIPMDGLVEGLSVQNVSAADFFSKFSEEGKSKQGYYFIAATKDLGIADDCVPYKKRMTNGDDISNPKNVQQILWVSTKGITAHMHYDMSHNFHTVIKGKKRVLLFPPRLAEKFHPFPHNHPSYRQMQIDINGAKTKRHHLRPKESVLSSAGQVAMLEEGDMIYIPPWWLHRIQSKRATASVSVLSPSQHEKRFADISWVELQPLSNVTDYTDRAKVVRQFILMLINKVDSLNQLLQQDILNKPQTYPTDFIRRLYESRYEPLMPKELRDGSYETYLHGFGQGLQHEGGVWTWGDTAAFCEANPWDPENRKKFVAAVGAQKTLVSQGENIEHIIPNGIWPSDWPPTQPPKNITSEIDDKYTHLDAEGELQVKPEYNFTEYEDAMIEAHKSYNRHLLFSMDHIADDLTVHFSNLPISIRETQLMNYIEEAARWAIGSRAVPVFLRDCF